MSKFELQYRFSYIERWARKATQSNPRGNLLPQNPKTPTIGKLRNIIKNVPMFFALGANAENLGQNVKQNEMKNSKILNFELS